MAQILDPLPNEDSAAIICCYVNASSKIQIARITNVPGWYFERVVFPGQRLMFEAIKTAQLEIHTGMMASAILSDTVPCASLVLESELESGLSAAEPSAPLSSVRVGEINTADEPQDVEVFVA